MKTETVTQGSKAVVINTQDGKHSCRLYVSARDGIAAASATTVAKSFRRIEAARAWATAQVAL